MTQVRLTAVEAADRLGVKTATLYAYVSRGVLTRRRSPTGQSLFDASEVERLARRGRPRRTTATGGPHNEVVIESRVTELGADRPYYRGRDALELARTASFESVAEWLWTGVDFAGSAGASRRGTSEERTERGGEPGKRVEAPQWTAGEAAVSAARAAQSGLPAATLPLERLQLIVPALAAGDPLRANLDPTTVLDVGRALIAGMVDSLPDPAARASQSGAAAGASKSGLAAGASKPGLAAGASKPDPAARASKPGAAAGASKPGLAARASKPGPDASGSITDRLWAKLGPARPRSQLVDALRAALVLLADHELAASTLAVRVAASVKADPYAVVMAGLGTMSGPLHGGASLGAERLLAEVATPSAARDVIGLRLRQGERVPGFGHLVYERIDGRAVALLDIVRSLAASHPVLAVADAILAEVRRRRLPEPNIDFALAVLTRVAGMPLGSGEAVFAIARTAGWLAHAMEEYEHRTRLRPRAVYIGPPNEG